MNTERVNQLYIETSFLKQCVTAILGPRRVGKTYFVKDYATRHPEARWVFLNMDKMDERQRVEVGELSLLITQAARAQIGEGDKLWVVIDEAQKCAHLFDQVKILYDQFKDKDSIKFILTGSAVLTLHQLSAESLAGRIELHYLHTFTLREATAYHYPDIPRSKFLDKLADHEQLKKVVSELMPFKPLLETQLMHQLSWGGFPELFPLLTVDEKVIYLKNYLQTYLEKDIRSVETITDLNLYRNLIGILAEQTGSLRYDERIVEALKCQRDTVKKYRGYLEATLLFQEVYPYIGSSLKRLVKSPKGYLLDNGLVSLLTGILDLSVLEKSGLIGHRLENWFLNELNVLSARTSFPTQLYYWRTSSGIEVDFIWVKKPNIYPFEVTYSNKIRDDKVRNLTKFIELTPTADWGYYIYMGPFEIDEKKKIIFIPSWVIA
jgi:predicted AAA+ superfamily ATPase